MSLPEPLAEPYQRAITSEAFLTRVWGAPGTGKTTVAVERVLHLVDSGVQPDAVSLWCAARAAAGRTRVALSQRLGKASSTRLACTPASFAFAVVRRAEARWGTSGVRLLSGPEQDVLLADLLRGHAEGVGARPAWPPHLAQALPTRTFRQELRETIMRLIEIGATPEEVEEYAQQSGSPVWGPLATMMEEYLNVSQWRWPDAVDPSSLLVRAAWAIHEDPTLLDSPTSGVRVSQVVVDDAQELTEAGVMLLSTLAQHGVRLTLCGDPDVTVNTFRGATRHRFAAICPPAFTQETEVVLPARCGVEPTIAAVVTAVTERIGVTGMASHRYPAVVHPPTPVTPHETAWVGPPPVTAVAVGTASHPAQEVSGVVRWLTDLHDTADCPWEDLCVVVRGRADTAALRRELAAHQIPVAAGGVETPLREEPVAAALVLAVECAEDTDNSARQQDLPEALLELLISPLIGGSRADARRVRTALRRAAAARYPDLADGVERYWIDAVDGAAHTRSLTASQPLLAQLVVTVRAARRVLRMRGGAEAVMPAGASVEDVLWAAWEAADKAATWQNVALAGGLGAESAHRHLDAAVGLFAAARRFAERLPQHTVRAFIQHVRSQDLAEDRLSSSAVGGGVAVTTAAGAAGRRWAGVAVMGVTEGRWPNTRVRTGLLHADALVAGLCGHPPAPVDARTQVIHDETRMFVAALSRATRWLLVTATDGDDSQPSLLHAAVAAVPGVNTYDLSIPPWTLAMLVGDARCRWTHLVVPPSLARYPAARWLADAPASDVASVLARASDLGVRAAHPRSWWGACSPTSSETPSPAVVRVSPSSLEKFLGCPRRWLLEAHGGATADSGVRADLGTLVHYITETADLTSYAAATQALQRWWHTLPGPSGWTRDALLAHATTLVEHAVSYHRDALDQGWEVAANEQWLRVSLNDSTLLTGRIDRLERRADGAVRVIDFKTGSPSAVTDATTNPQLGLYQVGVERGGTPEHGHESAGASLVFLSQSTSGKNFVCNQPPLRQAPDPGWAEHLILDAAQGMRGPEFPATPTSKGCRTCSFRSGCPAHVEPEAGPE